MKRKYVVSLKEVNYGSVSVKAENEEEARELARQEYYRGCVFWKDSDMELDSVEREQDRGYER